MKESDISLEHEIASFISKDNGATVHFKYEEQIPHVKEKPSMIKVSAFTVNNNNKEMFLLKSATAFVAEDALREILDYVKAQKGLSSFTVIWNKVDTNQPVNKSYFYCHDVTDVISKFFANKNVVDYIIYEIKLNPIS